MFLKSHNWRQPTNSFSSSDARDRRHSATLRPRPPDMPPPGGRRDRQSSPPLALGKKPRQANFAPSAVYYRGATVADTDVPYAEISTESDGER